MLGAFYSCTFAWSIVQDLIILGLNHLKHQIHIIIPYSFLSRIYGATKSLKFSTSGDLIKFNCYQHWIRHQIFHIYTFNFVPKSPYSSHLCTIMHHQDWLSYPSDLQISTRILYLPPPEPPNFSLAIIPYQEEFYHLPLYFSFLPIFLLSFLPPQVKG